MTRGDGRTAVLIVDNHALVQDGVREILEAQDDVTVVGVAGDTATAVALSAEKAPDIVLLDVEVPGEDVITTVGRIRQLSPDSAVVILTMFESMALLPRLLEAGIRGYLLMSLTGQDLLLAAIRAISSDDDKVILCVSRNSLAPVREPDRGMLSERERQILQLTAQALSNSQIASRLALSEGTVKRHLRNVFVKLGAVSRLDAVNKAAAASLIAVSAGDSVSARGRAPIRHRETAGVQKKAQRRRS